MKPWGEEDIIWVEQREERKRGHIIQIGDIESMAYLLELEADKVWLMNNRIDLSMWNQLYIYNMKALVWKLKINQVRKKVLVRGRH